MVFVGLPGWVAQSVKSDRLPEHAPILGWNISDQDEDGDTLFRWDMSMLAMRDSAGVPLHEVEDECKRSIDLVAHVMNQDEWRQIAEIRTASDSCGT
jgi:hypothetical protein